MVKVSLPRARRWSRPAPPSPATRLRRRPSLRRCRAPRGDRLSPSTYARLSTKLQGDERRSWKRAGPWFTSTGFWPVFRIRIRVGSGFILCMSVDPDPNPERQKRPTKRKRKKNELYFLKWGIVNLAD
jgi:hypothetical protein